MVDIEESGIERLLNNAANSADPPRRQKAPLLTRVVAVLVLTYGGVVGVTAATLMAFAPLYADPEGSEAVGEQLLFPLGTAVGIIGGVFRAAVATVAGNPIGFLVSWPAFAVMSFAIAVSQAFVVGAVILVVAFVVRRRTAASLRP